MDNHKFKQNVNLDAVLVHAAMRELFVPCAMQLGMKADEAFGRAAWLKKQSRKYIDAVVDKVREIEQED